MSYSSNILTYVLFTDNTFLIMLSQHSFAVAFFIEKLLYNVAFLENNGAILRKP